MTEPRTMHPGSDACDECVAELPEQFAAFPTVCPHRTSAAEALLDEQLRRRDTGTCNASDSHTPNVIRCDCGYQRPERVWVSTRRRGIDRHQLAYPGGDATRCGRSTRTGELRPAHDPWIVANTTPCPRCWPGGAR